MQMNSEWTRWSQCHIVAVVRFLSSQYHIENDSFMDIRSRKLHFNAYKIVSCCVMFSDFSRLVRSALRLAAEQNICWLKHIRMQIWPNGLVLLPPTLRHIIPSFFRSINLFWRIIDIIEGHLMWAIKIANPESCCVVTFPLKLFRSNKCLTSRESKSHATRIIAKKIAFVPLVLQRINYLSQISWVFCGARDRGNWIVIILASPRHCAAQTVHSFKMCITEIM